MADYIHGRIIAQSYANFYEANFREIPVEELRDELKSQADELRSLTFGFNSEVSVSANEGSLQLVTTVLETAGQLYHQIAEFGSFSGGVVVLYKLAKQFAKHQNTNTIIAASRFTQSPVHLEARTGLPGAFRRLLLDMKHLSDIQRDLSPYDLAVQLDWLAFRANSLLDKFEAPSEQRRFALSLASYASEVFNAPEPRRESLRPITAPKQDAVKSFILRLKDRPQRK